MNVAMWKKLFLAALGVVVLSTLIDPGALSIGQEAKAKKAKGRLPAYFADIVTEKQREEIYKIQAAHQKQIDDLEAQLAAARDKEMAEIEAVLDAEQKEKLKKARDEAAAKKKKKAPEAKAADTKPAEAAPKPKKAA